MVKYDYSDLSRFIIGRSTLKLEKYSKELDSDKYYSGISEITLKPLQQVRKHVPTDDEFFRYLDSAKNESPHIYEMIKRSYEMDNREEFDYEKLSVYVDYLNDMQFSNFKKVCDYINDLPKKKKYSALLYGALGLNLMFASGFAVNDFMNDTDNDGLSDDWEVGFGTNPNKPTVLIEVDYYQDGCPVHDPLSDETKTYMKNLFNKNGLELLIDDGDLENSGSQVIKNIDKSESSLICDGERDLLDGSSSTLSFIDNEYISDTKYGKYPTFETFKKIHDNPNYFSEERKGKFRHLIISNKELFHNQETLNNGGVLGKAEIPGDLFVMIKNSDMVKYQGYNVADEKTIFAHELGHSFGFVHNENIKDVMCECKNRVTDYSSDQWEDIKNGEIKNSFEEYKPGFFKRIFPFLRLLD